MRLFLYNEGSNWSGVALFGAKLPKQELPAIPCCKHSIKQVETPRGFRVLTGVDIISRGWAAQAESLIEHGIPEKIPT